MLYHTPSVTVAFLLQTVLALKVETGNKRKCAVQARTWLRNTEFPKQGIKVTFSTYSIHTASYIAVLVHI